MIFEPLYSPDLGLVGFRCRCGACTRVVRTQRGAEMHCWRKHKVKAQMEMTYGEPKEAAGVPIRESVRDSRLAAAKAVLLAAGHCARAAWRFDMRSKKIILVGEAPSRKKRAILEYEVFSGLRCERVNLLKYWRGRSGKGSLLPAKAARRAADRLVRSGITRGKLVVFVGKRVAKAFGCALDYLQRRGDVVVFPHPSGVNHWWNERANRLRAVEFIKGLKRCAS